MIGDEFSTRALQAGLEGWRAGGLGKRAGGPEEGIVRPNPILPWSLNYRSRLRPASEPLNILIDGGGNISPPVCSRVKSLKK